MLAEGKSVAVFVRDNAPRAQERFVSEMRRRAMDVVPPPECSAVVLGPPGGGGSTALCDWRFACDKALRFSTAGEPDAGGGAGAVVSPPHARSPRRMHRSC